MIPRSHGRPGLSFGNGTLDTPLTLEMWMQPGAVAASIRSMSKSGEYRSRSPAVHRRSIIVELREPAAGPPRWSRTWIFGTMVGEWHHLAVTYDGRGGAQAANGLTLYFDGLPFPGLPRDRASYVAMENLTAPLEIGRET